MSSLTIEGLSERSGVSTRNIRAFQSRGLLPGPQRVGRVGYYNADHLERLRLITSLQERTYGLPAIAELLAAHEDRLSVSALLGVETMLTPPWVEEKPLLVSQHGLEEIFPELARDTALLERAIELGLIVQDGKGFRITSPQILQTGGKLAANGVPAAAILEEAALLEQDTAQIAERFYELVKPSVKRQLLARQPLSRVLSRLRPLAVGTLESFFRKAMADAERRLVLETPHKKGRRSEVQPEPARGE